LKDCVLDLGLKVVDDLIAELKLQDPKFQEST